MPMIHKSLTTDELIGKAINRLRFKTYIWEAWADNDRVFIMVNDVRKLANLEPMARKTFDDGIKYCHIFSPDYRSALIEFRALCWGDW